VFFLKSCQADLICSPATLFIQKLNKDKVGKFSFANRLNGNVPLLSDIWLDGNEKQMK
jgi:hypothetical protein